MQERKKTKKESQASNPVQMVSVVGYKGGVGDVPLMFVFRGCGGGSRGVGVCHTILQMHFYSFHFTTVHCVSYYFVRHDGAG